MSHDHGFKPGDWPFSDPENALAICCRHVLEGKDILRVTHEEDDGCWQILCGRPHIDSDAKVVCLACMVKSDDSLRELAGLAHGWSAERADKNSPWERAVNPPEDNEEG